MITPLPLNVNLVHTTADYGGYPGGGTPDNLYEAISFSLKSSHMTMGPGLFLYEDTGSIVNSTLTMTGYPAELVVPGHLDIARNSVVTVGELAGAGGTIAVNHSTLNITESSKQYYPGGIPSATPPTPEVISLASSHLNLGTMNFQSGMLCGADITMDKGSSIMLNDTHATFEIFSKAFNHLDLYNGSCVASLTVHSSAPGAQVWATNVGSSVMLTDSIAPPPGHILAHFG